MIFSRIKVFIWLICITLILCLSGGYVEGAKKAATPSAPAAPVVHEPVIEEVTQKQLERILQDKDYVAVYWCKCRYISKKKKKIEGDIFQQPKSKRKKG